MVFIASLDGHQTEVIAEGAPSRMHNELESFAICHHVSFEVDAEDCSGAVGDFYRDGEPAGFWAILQLVAPVLAVG